MAGIFSGITSILGRSPGGAGLGFCHAVVVAGGSSARMGGEDKLMAEIGGIPAFVRSLAAFEDCPSVKSVVLVARAERLVDYSSLIRQYGLTKVSKIVSGGDSRTDSVERGLAALPEGGEYIAAIHDAARPLVKPGDIEKCIAAARSYHAAALAVPVTDTLKKRGGNMMISETLDREGVFAVQTPQCFDAALIKGAYKKARDERYRATDDCALIERMGVGVFLCEGSRTNIKLTVKEDIFIANALFEAREAGGIGGKNL